MTATMQARRLPKPGDSLPNGAIVVQTASRLGSTLPHPDTFVLALFRGEFVVWWLSRDDSLATFNGHYFTTLGPAVEYLAEVTGQVI